MRKYYLYTFLMGAVIVLFSSCASVYQPSAVHVPGLEKRKDLSVKGSVGTSGGDVSVAFSPLKNMGIIGQFTTALGETEVNGTVIEKDHNIFQGGLGYYNVLSEKLRFESYFVYGTGTAANQLRPSLSASLINNQTQELYLKGRFDQFSLLTGITQYDADLMTLGFFTRIVYGNFIRHNGHVRQKATGEMYPFELPANHFRARDFFTVEPVVHAEYKHKYFNIIMQVGYSMKMSEMQGEYNPLIINMGMAFNFSLASKNQKLNPLYE